MASGKLNTHMVTAAEQAGGVLRSRYGMWGLALISFVESALIVPIITDPFLIAYILANKTKTTRAIVVTTAASVIGGVAAYFIAVGFFEVILSPYIGEVTRNEILTTAARFEDGTFLLTLTGAVTPVPYTFVALAAGLVQASLIVFIVASILGRGFRYAFEGYLVYYFGEYAMRIVKKQIVVASIVCGLAILVYIFLKL